MIIDKTENAWRYQALLPQMAEILEFAKDAANREAGTYPFPWGRIMIQEGNTRHLCEADFEAHDKYLDIQWMLSGSELVEWANVGELTETIPYDSQGDIRFLKGKGSVLEVPAGVFYLVYPEDAHKPCCHRIRQGSYKKMVVKIRVA